VNELATPLVRKLLINAGLSDQQADALLTRLCNEQLSGRIVDTADRICFIEAELATIKNELRPKIRKVLYDLLINVIGGGLATLALTALQNNSQQNLPQKLAREYEQIRIEWWIKSKLPDPGAEGLLRRTLELRQKYYGITDYRTAVVYDGLGMILDAEGRHTEAQSLRMTAFKIERNKYGLRHRGTAATLSNLGICLAAQKRYEEGLEFASQSLSTLLELYGRSDIFTVAATFNVYQILKAQKKLPSKLLSDRQEGDLQKAAEESNVRKFISVVCVGLEQVSEELKKLAGS